MLDNMNLIGNRIKMKREELGMKQQFFAELIKIDKSSLNRYEKGKQTPSLETLVSISNGLNESLDYLVYGEDGESAKKASKEENYSHRILRALITLIEEGVLVVVNEEINGIVVNFKKSPAVLGFFEEATNFCRCRNRIDDKSYNKGIERIIADYEEELISEDQINNPLYDYPDYSRAQQRIIKSDFIMKQILEDNKKIK